MPNADKLNSRSDISMNFKYIAMVAVMAAISVGTTVITADSAFADEKNKRARQSVKPTHVETENSPLNIGCQNIDSQIQGDENGVSLAAEQAFPSFDHGGK